MQKVIERNGHYVVVTRIGKRFRRKEGQRWEIEHTNARRETRLYCRHTLRGVVALVRYLTHNPSKPKARS